MNGSIDNFVPESVAYRTGHFINWKDAQFHDEVMAGRLRREASELIRYCGDCPTPVSEPSLPDMELRQ